MPNLATPRIPLAAHPTTQSGAIKSLDVQVSVLTPGILTLGYTLQADMSRLRVGPEGFPGPADDLWKHTCFEVFIQPSGSRGYYEFNFSPSGEWSAYSFRDYRDGGPYVGDEPEPKITVERGAASVELSAVIRLDHLPGIQPDVRLRVRLSTVIEDLDGSLSYWALKHPAGKPDFHHSDNFVLEFEPKVVDGAAIDYTIRP